MYVCKKTFGSMASSTTKRKIIHTPVFPSCGSPVHGPPHTQTIYIYNIYMFVFLQHFSFQYTKIVSEYNSTNLIVAGIIF